MNKEEFDQLKLKVEQDLELTEDNVYTKVLKLPSLYGFYSQIYINERRIYKYRELELAKIFKQRYHYYKFDGQFTLGTVKEIEYYVNGDDEYYKANLSLQSQEIIVDFLKETLDSVKKMGFAVTGYIELYKLKNGLQ